jgi:cysteinyl-tRNA synthetase
VVLVRDVIEKGFDPLALRLAFLESKYRNQLDLSWDAIRAADKTIKRWRLRISEWGIPAADIEIEEFMSLIRNDLDFPRALVKLRALEKDSSVDASVKSAKFLALDKILGLNLQSH